MSGDLTCYSCRYGRKTNYFDQYECRRNAPKEVKWDETQIARDGRKHVPVWPLMRGEDWCGEYEPA